MSIAFDSASAVGSGGPAINTLLVPHTCSALGDRVLIICVLSFLNNINSVSYDGVAAANLQFQNIIDGSGWTRMELWVVFNPHAGLHNIAIGTSSNTTIAAVGCSYTGVFSRVNGPGENNQTTVVGTTTINLSALDNYIADGVAVGCFRNEVANFSSSAGGTTFRGAASSIQFADSLGTLVPLLSNANLGVAWVGAGRGAGQVTMIYQILAPVCVSPDSYPRHYQRVLKGF